MPADPSCLEISSYIRKLKPNCNITIMRKAYIAITSLLSPWLCLEAGAVNKRNADTSRPNVIIILADDLGYGDLGCYGAQGVSTPHVDALASQGIRFTDAHAVAATSTPSRYSLLTGEYAWRREGTDVAAGNAGMIIRPEQFTLADAFKSRGYATCALGKWHLGLGDKTGEQDWNAPLAASPADLGFDYHYIMAATADRVPCVFIENGMVANWDASAPIEVSYVRNFAGEPTGKDHPELLYNQRPSHGHDMSIVNGISRIGYMKGGGTALWKDENIADSIARHATDFIERHQNEPFFMYLATNDVHVPRFPHTRFRGQSSMGLRGDAIVQFDWTVGEVMKTLRRLGIADNTLVILTSDNGPVVDDGYDDEAQQRLGEHRPWGPWRGGKYSAFEGGTEIPLIVSWPKGVKAGQTLPTLISQIDFMSSLAALVSARLPKGSAPDSENRLPALLGRDSTNRSYVVEEAYNHVLSIRTPQWKYIEPSDGPARIPWGTDIESGSLPMPQLYDMSSDGGETRNVAADHPQTVYELQNILRRVRH